MDKLAELKERTRKLLERDAAFLADDPDSVILSQTAARDCGQRIRQALSALTAATARAEALERKVVEAREVVAPFAEIAGDRNLRDHPDSYAPRPSRGHPNLGHFRRAAAFLADGEE